ncbi:MAG: transcription/translation regulatory transformer protein RfaH [Gallionellaceae bacterium]
MKMATVFGKLENRERWFAVYCKPRQELIARENLERQGFHPYLPRIQVRRHRRGKWADTIEVLFPRYIFIRVDPDRTSIAPVRSTRGVVGLVNFGGQPAVVADQVMEMLLRHEDAESGLHRDSRPPFCAGEKVRLVEGPLAGLEGVFSQEDGAQRVMVLLELLGKTNRVAVNRDWVVKAA